MSDMRSLYNLGTKTFSLKKAAPSIPPIRSRKFEASSSVRHGYTGTHT